MNPSLPMGPLRRIVHILLKVGILLWTFLGVKTFLEGPTVGWVVFVPVLVLVLVLWLNWRRSLWGAFVLIGFGILLRLFGLAGGHHQPNDEIQRALLYGPLLLLGILLLIGVLIDRSRRK
jgi:hypothetical protein